MIYTVTVTSFSCGTHSRPAVVGHFLSLPEAAIAAQNDAKEAFGVVLGSQTSIFGIRYVGPCGAEFYYDIEVS